MAKIAKRFFQGVRTPRTSATRLWRIGDAFTALPLWTNRPLGSRRTEASEALSVFARNYPEYRFVDVYRAVEAFCSRFPSSSNRPAYAYEALGLLISGSKARMVAPTSSCHQIHHDKSAFFPDCSFWSLGQSGASEYGSRIVMKLFNFNGNVLLEIAARTETLASQIADELDQWSVDHSIYRNQTLHLQSQESPDDYGHLSNSRLEIKFTPTKKIDPEVIVLEDEISELLRRNVFLFHQRCEELVASGVSSRRALLFHGPPGTGKTYTTQFISSQLAGQVTTFIATGQSLNRIETICQLARLLQPSLVIVEDIDLVFTSREINLYSTALGDFMDQLDGFKPDDRITFLMTTNAIDRVEQALKDRPGRVNQCVYFGPPEPSLRAKYLRLYIDPTRHSQVDLDRMVEMTGGVTQAFLKELYQRAVLVAIDRESLEDGKPRLSTSHFEEAYQELTSQSGQHEASIMGFSDAKIRNGRFFAK